MIIAIMGQASTTLGFAPRSNSGGTNNLPPILFHQVHGENIRISGDGSVARRVESFCRGVAFSSRPIKINEKVCIKFLEMSNNWSGVIRFGFTSNDPSNLRYSLPKYVCPDLTSKPGYWAKALAERFAERDTILYYYVTQMGDVYFGINGEEKGIFLSGVETRSPLWALFDVYGNSTGIELVDHRTPLNNSRRAVPGSTDISPDIDSQILPSLQSLCIQNSSQRTGVIDNQTESTAVSRYHQTGTELIPLPFHRICGRNVRMSNDRCIATRSDTEFCLGYAFTSRPINLGEKIIIQVLETDSMYAGALAFGLTSCDPATLQSTDLPEDSNSLLDRPEYWVVQKEVASNPQRGDELAFSVLPTGEVQFSRNGGQNIVFMHVDQTLQLWAFFDIYGTTQKIRILGSIPGACTNSRASPPWPRSNDPAGRRLRISSFFSDEASQTVVNGNGQNPMPRVNDPAGRRPRIGSFFSGEVPQAVVNGSGQNPVPTQNSQSPGNGMPHRHCCVPSTTTSTTTTTPPEVVQFQPTMGGGTVLVVNLPPAHSNFINHQQQQQQQQQQLPVRHSVQPSFNNGSNSSHSNGFDRIPATSGVMTSNYTNTYIESISPGSYPTVDSSSWGEEAATTTTTSSECSICYERSIDSVLYMCGHMCMCYECAVQQWRGKGGGHCPLCRAVIRDVIRTYKS